MTYVMSMVYLEAIGMETSKTYWVLFGERVYFIDTCESLNDIIPKCKSSCFTS